MLRSTLNELYIDFYGRNIYNIDFCKIQKRVCVFDTTQSHKLTDDVFKRLYIPFDNYSEAQHQAHIYISCALQTDKASKQLNCQLLYSGEIYTYESARGRFPQSFHQLHQQQHRLYTDKTNPTRSYHSGSASISRSLSLKRYYIYVCLY